MKKFREIAEKAGDTAVFTFGRFNPPTIGHEKLINALAKQQSKNAGSKMYVYASKSNDAQKNPLPYAKKIAYMRKMFKKYSRNIVTGKPRTAIEVAVELYDKGHRAIVMVVGSDRVAEFNKILEEYNGVEGKRHGYYGFDNIEVVSAGERDPDGEGVAGMSASKMRAAAEKSDFDSFKTGIPDSMSDADKKKMYFDVRKGQGIREERDMGNDYDSLRDAYLTGKIWNVGESVEAKGLTGEIVRKGTNYLSFVTEDGKVHKAWLHEIELDEDASVYKKTARKNKNDVTYAFGRTKKLDGQPKEKGGYWVWKLSQNYDGKVKGGIRNSWSYVAKDLSYSDAVKLMNKKLGRKEFKEEVELDERNYAKEYANYQGTPEQIARRSSRNKARRAMGDKAVAGMDVGHIDNDPMNNSPENLRMEKPSDNRREPRLRENKLPSDELNWIKTGGMVGKKRRFPTYIVKKEGNKYKAYDEENLGKFKAASNSLEGLAKLLKPYIEKRTGSWKFEAFKEAVKRDAGYPADSVKIGKKHWVMYKDRGSWWANEVDKKGNIIGDGIFDSSKKELVKMLVKENIELEEIWWDNLKAKISQIRHPKGWDLMVKRWADGMKDKKHRDHPQAWAQDVAREYRGVDARQLIKYINTLVAKGKLPKELKAELQRVNTITALEAKSPLDKLKAFDKSRVAAGKPPIFTDKKPPKFVRMKKAGQMTIMNVPTPEIDKYEKKGYKIIEKLSFKEFVEELGSNATQKDYIDDFLDSDAPQFKGKDKKERIAMAVAAFRSKNEETELNEWGEITEVDAKSGKELNNPTKGDVKKYKVYVKNDKGNVVKVEFGDPNMEIKRDDPQNRASFRARHNCDNPGPKWKARYWSCKFWSSKSVTDLMKG